MLGRESDHHIWSINFHAIVPIGSASIMTRNQLVAVTSGGKNMNAENIAEWRATPVAEW